MPEGSDPDIVVTGSRDIIVTGTRFFAEIFVWPSDWISSDGVGGGFRYDNGWDGDGFYGGGGPSAPQPVLSDEAVIEVRVAFDRPLTAAEQKAVEHLLLQIQKQTAAIDALPDNATLRLANGSLVTGAELKALWSRTDFVLNEAKHTYDNLTMRGESALNGGNPQISFNIDILVGYDTPSGMAYVIAHELGHLTSAGQAANNARSPDTEMIGNDVARAMSNLQGITPLESPGGGGYSPGAADHFDIPSSTPTPNPQPAGEGGTGGGGRFKDDRPGTDSWYQPQSVQNLSDDNAGQAANTSVEPLTMEIPVIC